MIKTTATFKLPSTPSYKKCILDEEFIALAEEMIEEIKAKKDGAWKWFVQHMKRIGIIGGIFYHVEEDLYPLIRNLKPFTVENISHLSLSKNNYDVLRELVQAMDWKEGIHYLDFDSLCHNLLVYFGVFPFECLPGEIQEIIFSILRKDRNPSRGLVCTTWRYAMFDGEERWRMCLLSRLQKCPSIRLILEMDNVQWAERMVRANVISFDPTKKVRDSRIGKVYWNYPHPIDTFDEAVRYKASKIIGRFLNETILDCTKTTLLNILSVLLLHPEANKNAIKLVIQKQFTRGSDADLFYLLWMQEAPIDLIEWVLPYESLDLLRKNMNLIYQEIEMRLLLNQDTMYHAEVWQLCNLLCLQDS